MVAALDGGDVALIVLSAFWGLLVLFLCIVLLNTFRIKSRTKDVGIYRPRHRWQFSGQVAIKPRS